MVNNVLSLATVPWIMAHGAQAYHDFGLGRSRGTIPVQIAGNVRHGGLFEAAFGMTLREIVHDVGGGTLSGRPVKAVQVGGPLGAYFPASKLDTPFGYEEFDGAGGLIGHAGVVVFDVGVNRVDDETAPRGNRIVGDVDFAGVSEVASAMTPVPGGVGPMTITMLLANTLEAARRSRAPSLARGAR